MRKPTISAITILAAAVCLAACAAQPEAAAETTPLLELKIGSAIDMPYFYMGEDGKYTGIDKEIATEACRRMGYTPVFTTFVWGEQDDLLQSGTVDCIWDCFAMNGREDMYQWAGPYMTDPEMVVVSADSDIYTLSDLAGKTISMRVGSKAEDYFLKEGGTALLTNSDTELCTFDNIKDAFVYFGKGYADAVVSHEQTLLAVTGQQPQLYRYLQEPVMQLDLGVAFYKDHDPALVEALQATLDEMKADGTIAAIAADYGVDAEKAGVANGNP